MSLANTVLYGIASIVVAECNFWWGGTLAKMHTYHSLQGYPPCKIACSNHGIMLYHLFVSLEYLSTAPVAIQPAEVKQIECCLG